jgi:hypothetical protein
MRKLVFAALAGVFMLSSGFSVEESAENITAENDSTTLVVNESAGLDDFGTCNFTLRTTYYIDGGSYSVDRSYSAEASSQAECDDITAATAWMENFVRAMIRSL